MDSSLYVVATPIGNLGDMVPRAVEILQSVSLIAAEDTRHSGVLLKHFGIGTPMLAYHDHSDDNAIARIQRCMEAGESVALISDAGTPLISDPGFRLLRHAHEQGWRVVPVPGACALVAALSVAGLPTDRFRFEGFLPAKSAARSTRLEELAGADLTLVFYEAPHRVVECLRDMKQAFGDERRVVLARELTKTFETVLGAPVAELLQIVEADDNQSRGEIVLLVEGAVPLVQEVTPEIVQLLGLLAAELPPKRAAAIAAEVSGVPKKDLYNWILAHKAD